MHVNGQFNVAVPFSVQFGQDLGCMSKLGTVIAKKNFVMMAI
jgi:hypothetical protein